MTFLQTRIGASLCSYLSSRVPGVVSCVVHIELSGWPGVVGNGGGAGRHPGSWEQCRGGVESCRLSGNERWGGLEGGVGWWREA